MIQIIAYCNKKLHSHTGLQLFIVVLTRNCYNVKILRKIGDRIWTKVH